jgi:YVTN family beta-propeller protein
MAVIVAGIAATGLVLANWGGGSSAVVPPNSLAVIDPGTNRVTRSVPVGDTPSYVSAVPGAVWVLNSNEHTLSRVDPRTKASSRVGSSAEAVDAVAAPSGVWVSSTTHSVSRIDPVSNLTDPHVVELPTRPVDVQSSWVASDGREVWATSPRALTRIRPGPTLSHRIDGDSCCRAIALGDGSAWITGIDAAFRVDLRTLQEKRIDLPVTSEYIAYGNRAAWIPDEGGDTLFKIDSSTARPETITIGEHPAGVAVGDGSVWVARTDGYVLRLDPRNGEVQARIHVGNTPRHLAYGDGAVWVSVD